MKYLAIGKRTFASGSCLEVTEESHKTSVLYAEEHFHFLVCHIQYLGIFFMEITLNEELFCLPLLLPICYCN